MTVPVSPWQIFPDLVIRLKEMLEKNWTFRRIAGELGCGLSRNAIIGKAKRMGLHQPSTTLNSGAAKKIQKKRDRSIRRIHIGGQSGHPVSTVIDNFDLTPAPDDLAIPVEQRKTLMQLTDTTCRWPVNEPGDPDFFFCGALAEEGFPYCQYHHKRAIGPRHGGPARFVKPQF